MEFFTLSQPELRQLKLKGQGALDWTTSRFGTYPSHDQELEDNDTKARILNPEPCQKCRGITLTSLMSKHGYQHHQHANALRNAAKRRCRICLWIYHSLFPEPELDPVPDGAMAPTDVPRRRKHDRDVFSVDLDGPIELRDTFRQQIRNLSASSFPLILQLDPDHSDLRVQTRGRDQKSMMLFSNNENTVRRGCLLCNSSLKSTLSRFEPLLLSSDSSTQEVLPPLPRRVIDVNDKKTSRICLKDFGAHSPKERYVCLSHRWRQSVPLTTETTNIHIRERAIDVKELPPTFIDAIAVTRGFGIRYLWIDSMCILQDSQSDWEIESSKMGSYYSNSWLTVGAGLPTGLFGPRFSRDDGSALYRLPVSNSQRRQSEHLYLTSRDSRGHNYRFESLLYTRGWTLQEEVLSPRFLSFQPRQNVLRIGSSLHYETGLTESAIAAGYFNIDDVESIPWTNIVEDYSRRILTEPEDKLPALSGLAQRYSASNNDTYLAGLWRQTLLDDLCWYVQREERRGAEAKPEKYRAPSWSWASLDSPVTFDQSSRERRGDLDILGANTAVEGQDPLGQVRGGMITLRARLSKQRWKRKRERGDGWYYEVPLDGTQKIAWDTGNGPFSSAVLMLDVDDRSTDMLDLWSLPLKDSFALALRPTNDMLATFERVGMICWRSLRDDGVGLPMQKIEII